MKLPAFEYHAPRSIEETLSTLLELGEDAKLLAGGQSLLALMALRLARPTALVDLAGVGELRGIEASGRGMRIGAMTSQAELEDFALVDADQPLLAQAIRWIGHRPIRNRGTIGGSLAHADPAAELPLAAVVLDADIEITSKSGTRFVPAPSFFVGFLEAEMQPDEVLAAVHLPAIAPRTGTAFEELARRHGDFAMVSAAATVTLADDGTVSHARFGLGAVDRRPVRLPDIESALVGMPAGEVTAGGLSPVLDELAELISPPEDVHATGAYRTRIARHLANRVLTQAVEAAGRIPDGERLS